MRPNNNFELIAPERLVSRLSLQGRFVTNDSLTLIYWLKAGNGIAYVPMMRVIEEINAEEIDILFPRYQSDPHPVYALYTKKDKLPLKKMRVCIDYLTEYFQQVTAQYQQHRAS